MLRHFAILCCVAAVGLATLPTDLAAQRRGGRGAGRGRERGEPRGRPTEREARGPGLPAPLSNLPDARKAEMRRLGQLSVAWLGKAPPPVNGGDPVIDLFGPFSERRSLTDPGEETTENEWGLLVLSGLNTDQTKVLFALATRQQVEMAKYLTLRKRLLATLLQLRGTTVQDRTVDVQIKELGRALGEQEGAMAFDQAAAFGELGRTLSEEQRAFLQHLRDQPEIFNMDAPRVITIREWVAKLDGTIQLPLQDLAAQAGSFLTGTAAENTKDAPRRPDLLGETSRRTPDYVISFLESAGPDQLREYAKLLNGETSLLASMASKRTQILASLELLKRSHSISDSRVVALAAHFGEMESRLALLRVRSFENIRETLTDVQRVVLQQAAQ